MANSQTILVSQKVALCYRWIRNLFVHVTTGYLPQPHVLGVRKKIDSQLLMMR